MLRVLLCSDVPDDRIQKLLGGAARVDWEGSYDSAKLALERDEHDAYLIDALFGGGRGASLAQAMARRGARPVIVLARRPDATFEAKTLARGVADVLVQGELTAEVLERALRHAIARASRERRVERTDQAAPTVGVQALQYRLENAVARARRGFGGAAVLAIRWDAVLREDERVDTGAVAMLNGVALERIRSCLRDVETLCRSETTFFALVEERDPKFRAGRIAERVLVELGVPVSVHGKPLSLVPSVGVAVYPEDGEDGETLLRKAREALALASEAGGAAFRFPSAQMTSLVSRRMAIERGLERALEQEDFLLEYQPQVDLETDDLVGVEALLRWRDEQLGDIEPTEFVPLLESADLIEEVGEWVLRSACKQAAAWAQAGEPLKISVNVSAKQFILGDVVRVVQSALADSKLPAELLTLELTEGVMLDTTPAVREALRVLRETGVRVAVDDFGTGYASLRYVKHFPMDVIKIDKEFVRGLPLNAENAAITNAIVSLAHSLNLAVVAEGVENEAEAEFLRDLRCSVVQGYLHARPMIAERFAEWRKQRKAK
ncbi:MAG TPA: GGDEF domain-containing phosphodiesterase [Polyangiaceae bacterium]|nr:GGDEF domain-containing phosphodiesterase [Polyangiaceae bacterium]